MVQSGESEAEGERGEGSRRRKRRKTAGFPIGKRGAAADLCRLGNLGNWAGGLREEERCGQKAGKNKAGEFHSLLKTVWKLWITFRRGVLARSYVACTKPQ